MSTSADVRVPFGERVTALSNAGPLAAILAAGLLLRLIFIGGGGFHNDISAFEAWALTLTEHPLSRFYASTSFADYPPGYFFVLVGIGWLYKALVAVHAIAPDAYAVLGMLVKLPAIAMDLVDAWLIFRIAGRFTSRGGALVAAALFALNPAAIYVSAYWGQVDSVSWGLVLAGIELLLASRGDQRRATAKIALAWSALAFSVLMKPQGTFVGFIFAAFALTASKPAERAVRLRGTALGLGCGVVLAWIAAAVFHGTLAPSADFSWLLQRYAYGSTVYTYNSINAFNLYALRQPFWQQDDLALSFFGLPIGPMVVWGGALVAGSTALIVARYLQRRDDRALLEAAMLVSFAFFILATRMHERYVFGAFLLLMPLAAFGRRYRWSIAVLTLTFLVNLVYSLHYQTVMEQKIPGVDPTDLWPLVTHPLALVNVALFFFLGYLYLGGTAPALPATRLWARARAWFDPRAGLAAMRPLDWGIAGALTAASFVVCILWYQWPAEKIFDEIYYARAGEEYLGHKEIFEFTHPPLTKLIVTLSMTLFGGLHGAGDTGAGWRFLNVVIGALTVGLMYLFAKRLTASTFFAAAAAGMLLLDGFHFVQSRIATPEITVAFFALATLYAFYRLWTAAQVRRRPLWSPRGRTAVTVTLAAGTPLAAILASLVTHAGTATGGQEFTTITLAVAFLYFEGVVYLAARLLVPRWIGTAAGFETSYADGTRVRTQDGVVSGTTLDEMKLGGKSVRAGEGELKRSFDRNAALTYETPLASATFTATGTMTVGRLRLDAGEARMWFVVLAVCGAALAASKWNGLFDFFVVWGVTALVACQRWLRRPAVYGNPFGIPFDILLVGMLVAGGAVYAASYVPYFLLGHNLVDLVSLQQQMYQYHATLKATHPYASQWWQWPILQRPIQYYYHDFRTGAALQDGNACCVADILALPNPFVWWLGLVSVPAVAILAWLERNRGYALLVVAYVLQWLPWIGSPRIAFEYHFYPNLSIIVLANAILLQRVWGWRPDGSTFVPRMSVVLYLGIVAAAFAFFYPILAGVHIDYAAWRSRMWFNSWI